MNWITRRRRVDTREDRMGERTLSQNLPSESIKYCMVVDSYSNTFAFAIRYGSGRHRGW